VTHKTKGLVIRTVKYGETSVIVHIFTEVFGIQSYLVNGVRASSKKSPGKANMFQPGALLELVVYHNELANLQRIKEYQWAVLFKELFYDVAKNAVVLFLVELLQKTVKQPEANSELFEFLEDALMHLDEAGKEILANYPLFISLQLPGFFGFRISNGYTSKTGILELKEGEFVSDRPLHPYFLEGEPSFYTSELLKVQHPAELGEVKINGQNRRLMLQAYQTFFALHVPDFGVMKTIPVLQEVLS
jgi:DNA repair protein RecO (recombination protein O)